MEYFRKLTTNKFKFEEIEEILNEKQHPDVLSPGNSILIQEVPDAPDSDCEDEFLLDFTPTPNNKTEVFSFTTKFDCPRKDIVDNSETQVIVF